MSKLQERKLARRLAFNELAQTNQRMVFCESLVRRDAVRRESVNGIEHVVVGSFTLPDNIVMNGILYPADEIEKGYKTLERTLAPVEHPNDGKGNYLSANDPVAINGFYAGAWNENVSRSGGRVYLEKWINVAEAMKTDRGRRLLDRIKELETSSDPRPIHTSVGVFITVEGVGDVAKNDKGVEYTGIARNMLFDHDAILLDSAGAAQPHQGVGMAVNQKGQKVKVERNYIEVSEEAKNEDKAAFDGRSYAELNEAKIRVNAEGLGMSDLYDQLNKAIREGFASEWSYIVEVFEKTCVFETNIGYYEVPYRVDNGSATIVGIPVRVERNVTYTPKVNHSEGDAMKELIVNALKAAGVAVDGLTDEQLFAAYNKMQAPASTQAPAIDETKIGTIVANAVKPLADEVAGLKAKIDEGVSKERDELSKVVVNSQKYPGVDEAVAKTLPIETLRQMASACGESHGIPLTNNNGGGAKYQKTDLPD